VRIVINTRLLLPNRLEGIGRFTHEVARRLVARRPQDEFLFLFDRPFSEEFCYSAQVTPLVVPPPSRHPVLWYLWFEWAVPFTLNKHQADLFLSMDNYCSLRARQPTVMVTHDIAHVHYPQQIPALVRHYYNYYVPRYLERAEQIVTVSEFCRQDIHQYYHTALSKIGVSCNAAAPHFKPLSAPEIASTRQEYSQGQAYFFYLGAVHPRKNIARLIAAFDQFKKETAAPVKLLIGGRFAWQTGDMQSAYTQATHKEDILFLGYLADEDLPRLIGAALALTYVSLFEGFGVPLLEAMKAGVPVLTSSVSSMPEVAGEAALLVNPKNTEAIANGLLRLYKEDKLREDLIEKGFAQNEQYNWELATDAVEEAMEKAME
jgi:glycosyltransferase involved in cell wall biosynthesis